jgi:hypothetical protein
MRVAPLNLYMKTREPLKVIWNTISICQICARPKSYLAPFDFGMISQYLGKACLSDSFSQQAVNTVLKPF